jgi:hypothetical protein
VPVTIRGLTRTSVGLGLGRDWYLFGPGNVGCTGGTSLCFGLDGGVRWGTAHLDLNVVGTPGGYERMHDVYAEYFAAWHLDLQVPMGGWMFLTGLRGEWNYSGLNFLPDTQTGLHSANLLVTMGVRY